MSATTVSKPASPTCSDEAGGQPLYGRFTTSVTALLLPV